MKGKKPITLSLKETTIKKLKRFALDNDTYISVMIDEWAKKL